MRYILQLLVFIAFLPLDSHATAKKVKVDGVAKKQAIVKDSKGQKKKCHIVVDKKTKKEYLVCDNV